MSEELKASLDEVPEAMLPDLRMSNVDDPISIEVNDLAFVPTSGDSASLVGELKLRWYPSAGIEFEGECDLPMIPRSPATGISITDLLPEGSVEFGESAQRVPVIVTHANLGEGMRPLRFIINGLAELAKDPTTSIERVRFYLVNFPNYHGTVVKRATNGHTLFDGRLVVTAPAVTCTVDRIVEHDPLTEKMTRESGFLVTHLGELAFLRPAAPAVASVTMESLGLFFGFLRGGWCGPILPQGYTGDSRIWRQLASWRLDESGVRSTWLPRTPGGLDTLFQNFLTKSATGDWAEPMRTALDWYFSANSSRSQPALRLVLSVVALELLANVEVVEVRKSYSADQFKGQDAFKRIGTLFDVLKIPRTIPSHLAELSRLIPSYGNEAPEVLTRLRNRLVHSTAANRASLAPVSIVQLWQASELAIGYVELSLLAILGYTGKYARRAVEGWKGTEEDYVPWR